MYLFQCIVDFSALSPIMIDDQLLLGKSAQSIVYTANNLVIFNNELKLQSWSALSVVNGNI